MNSPCRSTKFLVKSSRILGVANEIRKGHLKKHWSKAAQLEPACPVFDTYIRGCADKYLARPGRKQATATKLGIYSTYSPRSSIHFLARFSNFCKPPKKIQRMLSVQPGLRGSKNLCIRRKMMTFHLFYQSRKQVVVRRGQFRIIEWVIKTMEAQVGQFLLGCKCPVSRSIVVQEQDPLGDLHASRRFSFKMSFNGTSRDE